MFLSILGKTDNSIILYPNTFKLFLILYIINKNFIFYTKKDRECTEKSTLHCLTHEERLTYNDVAQLVLYKLNF